MSMPESTIERIVNEEITYGIGNGGLINPFTDYLLTLERSPGETTQSEIDSWETQVCLWATAIDKNPQTGVDSQIDMPDGFEVISAELAYTAIRTFRNRRFNDFEKNALEEVVVNAIEDFFPDEYYIGRSQISNMLHLTVVSPVLTLMRFDAALWAQKNDVAEATP